MKNSPFACDMAALSSEQRSRHQQLGEILRFHLRAVTELPNGFQFEFPFASATFAALAALTPLEHACCPFFDISIVLEQAGKLCWRLTGSQGVKEFIRAEFSSWFAMA